MRSAGPLGTALAFVAVVGLTSLPLLLARSVPSIDYPFNLAHVAIQHSYPDEPFLQQIYAVHRIWTPNIAISLVSEALARFMPVERAVGAFLILSSAITISGVGALHRALFRSHSCWPLLFAALFAYNWIFLIGLYNYLFGLGVMLWALAAWIWMGDRPAAVRIFVGSLFALAIFYSHLIAFALFAAALGGLAMADALRDGRISWARLGRNALLAAAACVVPAVIFVAASPASGSGSDFAFQSPREKLESLLQTPTSGNPAADGITAAGLVAVVAIAWIGARVRVAASMRAVLVLFLLMFVAAPVGTGASWHIDDRIPIAILLLAAASIRWDIPAKRHAVALASVLLACIVARIALMAWDWTRWDRAAAEARSAFAQLPPGSVVYSASAARPHRGALASHYDLMRPPSRHLASYAALASRVFAPIVWAHPQLQPISVRPEFMPAVGMQGFDPIEIRSREHLETILEEIRATHRQLPAAIEHGYLFIHGSREFRSGLSLSDRAVVSAADFDIIATR